MQLCTKYYNMNSAHVSVSWQPYINHVSKGFSSLQQNAEFVDMTLAAEGHLVKVHQNIVALASPYLKAMLRSAPSPHPVIFLNNVTHEILGFILEYIYTGEAKIPILLLNKFIEVGQSLHIQGIDNINVPENINIIPADSVERKDRLQDNKIDEKSPNNCGSNSTECVNNNGNENTLSSMPEDSTIKDKFLDLADASLPLVAESENTIDPDDIADLVLFNPRPTSYDDKEVKRNKEDRQITVLSQVISNPHGTQPSSSTNNTNMNRIVTSDIQDWQIKVLNFDKPVVDSNTNSEAWLSSSILSNVPDKATETHNPSFNMTDWQNQTTPSNIELNPSDIVLPNDLTTNTHSWDVQPIHIGSYEPSSSKSIKMDTDTTKQTISHMQLDTNLFKNTQNKLNETKDDILMNIKKYKITKIVPLIKKSKTKGITKPMKISDEKRFVMDQKPHFTVSNRGALQLILHRYLYNCHHHSFGGQKRRWRCIDYRRSRCPAYVDTEQDELTSMSTHHDHVDHNNQIILKIKRNTVFPSIASAAATIENTDEHE